ncbi:MAG: cytochrome c [Nitrospira sp.]|nr:cytochrome c [Nitrospira sp.]
MSRGYMVLRVGVFCLSALVSIATGCVEQKARSSADGVTPVHLPDVRTPIPLGADAQQEHRAVMLQHLETVQAIVAALADEDYRLAQGLTESHLGFFMHRYAMARQEPADFPPAYHDLAMAHHAAAEKLADVMPTKDLKQILPEFNHVLKACVACHLEYRLRHS